MWWRRPLPAPDPDPGGRSAARDLTVLGTGLVIVFSLMARLDSWARALGAFQTLYLLAFAGFALALARARGDGFPRAGLLVFVVAAAGRLALLPVTPTLSDDVYRYVWEGRVVLHGGDPYRQSPDDPVLAPLRDRTLHPRINHPELATIYPPLAIAGFALVAAVAPSVAGVKSWVVLHDLAAVLLLLLWVRQRGGNPLAVIAYAWNPLVVVEFAGSGHHDPTAIVWLVAALLCAERRPLLSALALTAGVLTKLAPLLALPFLLRRWTPRARIVGLATLALGLGGYWSATRGVDSGLAAYARSWANNELLFAHLVQAIGDPGLARGIAAGVVLAIIAVLVGGGWDAARGTRAALRAAFLASPVAHPWYLAWVLAMEPLGPSAPWLLLSATAVLSYGVFSPPAAGGGFHLSLGGRWVEYGLPLLLAGVLAMRRRVVADGTTAAG